MHPARDAIHTSGSIFMNTGKIMRSIAPNGPVTPEALQRLRRFEGLARDHRRRRGDNIQVGDAVDENKMCLIAITKSSDIWRIWTDGRYIILKVPGLPGSDQNVFALQPWQIENEAAWLSYMKEKCPSVPVPYLIGYSSQPDCMFIAEQFIEGETLSDLWPHYTEDQKEKLTDAIGSIIQAMAELRFDKIGGLTARGLLGPTTMISKRSQGRHKFHKPECYDIGPYKTMRDYLLASYDKEIHYHCNAGDDIDQHLFATTSVAAFVQELRAERQTLLNDPTILTPDEPFVLYHGDLHGKNIIMRDMTIAAVLDWEYAGAYPLSQLNPLSQLSSVWFEVFESREGYSWEQGEMHHWASRIGAAIMSYADGRGWSQKDIDLICWGDSLANAGRWEMYPGSEEATQERAETGSDEDEESNEDGGGNEDDPGSEEEFQNNYTW